VSALLERVGIGVTLLTGSLKADVKAKSLEAIASGQARVVVGTHALIQDAVSFADLGLVVIDEQHRFGVDQRGALEAKSGGRSPHVLLMTATPIPRTLGQVLYADLDVSDLRTPPAGRVRIRTGVKRPADLDGTWQKVREEAALGHRTFVVVPLIGGVYTSWANSIKNLVSQMPRNDNIPLYIEILNECNNNMEWSGAAKPTEYAQFFVQVSNAIRSLNDPRIKIMNRSEDHLPEAHRRRAGHRPRSGHDRQLQVERDRGGAQVRVGQADRQFDQPEGRRGAVPRTGAGPSALTAPPSSSWPSTRPARRIAPGARSRFASALTSC
jgi:hypothetical protein